MRLGAELEAAEWARFMQTAGKCESTSDKKWKNAAKNDWAWPANDGCADAMKAVAFKKGDRIDRFGGPHGSFVGEMPNGVAASYTARSIPYVCRCGQRVC